MAKRTPNNKQRKAATNLILYYQKQRFKTLKELLIDAGYSELNAEKNSNQIISSKGVQDFLVSLGFTSDRAKARVAEILMLGEESNSLRAADMIFKVNSDYAPIKSEGTIKGYMGVLLKEIEDEQGGLIKETNS